MKTPVHGLIAGATLFAGAALAEINLSDGDLPDLKISGWVDFNYVQTDADTGAFFAEADTLALNEVEINFLFDFGNGLTAKFDLQADSAGQADTTGDGVEDVELEEAYFSYNFLDGEDSSLSLTAGRFFSYMGWESFDLTGLYQFSTGYSAVAQGLQDGLRLDYVSDMFTVGASVVDGVFSNDKTFNGGADDGVGAEFMVKFTGVENLEVFAGYGWNDSGAGGSDPDMYDLWISYQIGDLLLAAEYSSNSDVMGAGVDADAYLLFANYTVNDWLGFTARYSTLDVDGGAETEEFTLAALLTVHDNLGVIIEYRHDEEDVSDDEADTLAIEATLTF